MSDVNRKPLMDAAESETRWKLEGEGRGTVRKDTLPHAGHARCQGVGRSHSTEEAGEQSRPDGGGGVRGGKGIDQGER